MTFDNILKIYGQKQYQQIKKKLFNLGDKLFGNGKWNFVQTYDSNTETDLSGKYYVTIGERPLTDGCEPDKYNIAGYVLAVENMFHEFRHVEQYTKEWNIIPESYMKYISNIRRMTDTIRRAFVRDYYPSAYANNYANDPGEMDAEAYAVQCTLEYFRHDPIITEDKAKEILLQLMLSDNYPNKKIFNGHDISTIDDVIAIFKERRDKSVYDLYSITSNIPQEFEDVPFEKLDMTDDFLHSLDFESHRKAFKMCKIGVEQDKVLEQTILMRHPEAVKSVPRLRDELMNCLDQMHSGIIRTENQAIPPHKISYMKPLYTDEVELTDEDITNIPVDSDDIKL